jgi:hypothetical protein
MSDVQQAIVLEFLRPIMNAFIHRDEIKAVEQSKKCRFWGDGMLRQLKEISGGNAEAGTFELLKKNFEETGAPVKEAMDGMRVARDKIGAGKIAKEIDAALHSDGYGKDVIRTDIGKIIANPTADWVPTMAKGLCNRIDALNAALDRLHKLVYGE